MNIAYIVPSFANTAPVKIISYLIEILKNKHNIEIYYFKEKNGFDFDVKYKKISFFDKIDFDNYDIIHSHGVISDAYIYWNKSKCD